MGTNQFLIAGGVAILFLAFVASVGWRHACFLWILVAVVQDPIRKMLPGAPAILALATVPLWAAIVIFAFARERSLWGDFRRSYRTLAAVLGVFLLMLVVPAVKSATHSWQSMLLGLFSYGGLVCGFLVGYAYPRKASQLRSLLVFYCVLTGILMVGTLLEWQDLAGQWTAVGTEAMGHVWIRYTSGYQVKMMSGFYRSPDVMGWHAATLTMLAVALALSSKGSKRMLWIAMVGWGSTCALLCARRKMFWMLPLFALALIWIYSRGRSGRRGVTLLGVLLVALIAAFAAYQQAERGEQVADYMTDTGGVAERITEKGFEALLATYRQSGFMGEGLGVATLGAHHLRAASLSIPQKTGVAEAGWEKAGWQETGPSRILVELGVPGFVWFLFLGLVMFLTVMRLIPGLDRTAREFPLFAGLAAMFLANSASFVVSHQIFGDPFVNCFFPFLVGMLLSGTHFTAEARWCEALGADKQPSPPSADDQVAEGG